MPTLTYHATGASITERAEAILCALPDWFGIESSIIEYVEHIAHAPTFTIATDTEPIAGFVSMTRHAPRSAEIHVMAIDPGFHRRGLGRLLVDAAQTWCLERGVDFLQVKTLAHTSDDIYYALTRAFYVSCGFTLLEIFPTLWDPHNPCALYIKHLTNPSMERAHEPGRLRSDH